MSVDPLTVDGGLRRSAVFRSFQPAKSQYVGLMSGTTELITTLGPQSHEPWPIPKVSVAEPKGLDGPADLLWLVNNVLVMRPSARSALGEYLDCGVCLPTETVTDDVVLMFRPDHTLDLLDESASDIERFPKGNPMRIESYVFRGARPRDVHVFKLASFTRGPVFFSGEFVERVRSTGLTGLDFEQVGEVPIAR